MRSVLGERRISLCRELTKLNEEIMRTTLDAAIEYYTTNSPRGEYVLVVEGAHDDAPKTDEWWVEMTLAEHVDGYVARGCTKNEAIRKTAYDRGLSKNFVYKAILAESGE